MTASADTGNGDQHGGMGWRERRSGRTACGNSEPTRNVGIDRSILLAKRP
jgi:hypothetical protein